MSRIKDADWSVAVATVVMSLFNKASVGFNWKVSQLAHKLQEFSRIFLKTEKPKVQVSVELGEKERVRGKEKCEEIEYLFSRLGIWGLDVLA